MQTFDERVALLAAQYNFRLPLVENQLRIEQVHFFSGQNRIALTGSGESLKCRMFLEVQLWGQMHVTGQINFKCASLVEVTHDFFGPELCAESGLKDHPFIRGMLHGEHGIAYLKVKS